MKKLSLLTVLFLVFSLSIIRCASSDDNPPLPDQDTGLTDASSEDSFVFHPRDPDAGVPPPGSFDYFQPGQGPILYNGGPVMANGANVYVVWYGKWDTDTISLVEGLLANFGRSTYNQINEEYYQDCSYQVSPDASVQVTNAVDAGFCKRYVSSGIRFVKAIHDDYSLGDTLHMGDVERVVSAHLQSGDFPIDDKGIYFVFTSANVSQDINYYENYCEVYCGYHNIMFADDAGVWNDEAGIGWGNTVKFSFVGSPAKCYDQCSPMSAYLDAGFDHSPNNNWEADSIASIIIHELSETLTDPEISAWYSIDGNENADLAAWTYGVLYLTSNGSVANVRIGTKDWLIQQQWDLNLQKPVNAK